MKSFKAFVKNFAKLNFSSCALIKMNMFALTVYAKFKGAIELLWCIIYACLQHNGAEGI